MINEDHLENVNRQLLESTRGSHIISQFGALIQFANRPSDLNQEVGHIQGAVRTTISVVDQCTESTSSESSI